MLDKETLLFELEEEEREIGDKVLDKAEQALRSHQPQYTNFLNPRQLYITQPILEKIRDLKYLTYGGYQQAEREILALMPDYYIPDMVDPPLALLDIYGQFKFQTVSHRDFLGAILGTGIKRNQVGDLIIYDQGCQAIVVDKMVDYIKLNLDQVHKVGVEVEEIAFSGLREPTQRVKEIRDTVPSLRLDSVASSGFSTSRSKMSKEINKGRVRVNWKVVENQAHMLELDDIISIRGRGRVEIDELLGRSHKGRIKLKLKRYL